MKTYKLITPLTFTGGVLGLNKEQATKRMEHLKEQRKGEYLVINPVSFKAGEIISVDAPKAFIGALEEIKAKK